MSNTIISNANQKIPNPSNLRPCDGEEFADMLISVLRPFVYMYFA